MAIARETLRALLSEHALDWLEASAVEPAPRPALTREALRAALEARGWPTPEDAFALERHAGGLELGGKTRVGPRAAMERFDASPALRALTYEGAPLLPIDGSAMPELWMGRDGIIHLGRQGGLDGGDDDDFVAPVYGSWRTMFERLAFGQETWLRNPGGHPFRAAVDAEVGATLASILAAERFEAACDRFATLWHGPRGDVQQLACPGYRRGTFAAVAALDDLVVLLRAIAARVPGLPLRWQAPGVRPPGPDEPLTDEIAMVDPHSGRARVLAIAGGDGDFRLGEREG